MWELLRQDPSHFLQVLLGGQERRANPEPPEPLPEPLRLPEHGVVFHAVEQMGGLDHHVGDAIGQHPLQGV